MQEKPFHGPPDVIKFVKRRSRDTRRTMERFFLSRVIKRFPCKMSSYVLTNFSKNLSNNCVISKRHEINYIPKLWKEVSYSKIKNRIAIFGKYHYKGDIDYWQSYLVSNLKELHMYFDFFERDHDLKNLKCKTKIANLLFAFVSL